MAARLRCCNDTYTRDERAWRYPWGDPVPGASDLTLGDLLVLGQSLGSIDDVGTFRELSPAERRWLTGESTCTEQVALRRRQGFTPHVGDLIVGLSAPELQAPAMLTVGDIADAAGVTKATIDSYRYRGYLPQPQVVRGRTPLWTRPVVHHWLASRPGPGWRTDIYAGQDVIERTPALR